MSPEDPGGDSHAAGATSLRRLSTWIVVAALGVASAAFAYFRTFGRFAEYDDEGYFMVAVQHLLDGHRLYDDVGMVYGPGYFAYRWLIHGLCGLPLGNDVVRLSSIAMWLATSVLSGFVAHRLCKDSRHAVPLAVIATAFTVLHLRLLAREPGHPQELACGLVSVALCTAGIAFGRGRRIAAFAHGLVAGTLLLVKANLGLFFSAACLLAWVVDVPWRKAWGRCVLILGAAGALLVPFVLLHGRFQDPPAVILCAIVTCALGVSLLHALRSRTDATCTPGDLVSFLLGAGVAATACLAFIVLQGSSLGGVFRGAFVASQRFATAVAFAFPLDGRAVAACGVSAVVGLALARGRRRLAPGIGGLPLATAKLAFGLLVLAACLRAPELLVRFATPWVWLVLIVPDRTLSPAETFLRRLVCLTAVLQVLQIFPVPGTQVHTGTAPLLLVSVTCLADALRTIELRAVSPRTRAGLGTLVPLASAGVVGFLGWLAVEDLQAYRRLSKLDFAGCRLTRVPEAQALTLRWLVENLESSSDSFVSVQGQNSLYSWTGARPASPVIASRFWTLIDEAQQRELVEAHRSRPDAMIVDDPRELDPALRGEMPFFRFLDREFVPLARVAHKSLLVRQERPDVELAGCAWWVEGDDSTHDPSMRVLRLGLPPGRIPDDVERVEVVDVARSTILASSDCASQVPCVQLLSDERGRLVLAPDSVVSERAELLGLRFTAAQEIVTIPIARRMRPR